MTPFKADIIAKYMDSDGLVLPTQWGGHPSETGNGLLYMSLYRLICKKLGELEPEEIEAFKETVGECTISPGVYRRGPGKEETAWDDYVGVAAVSRLIGSQHAADIFAAHNYGSNYSWHPGLVSFFKWCAGRDFNIFDRIQIESRLRWDTCQGDANGHMISWIMVQALPESKATRYWLGVMGDKYKTLGAMLGEYFTPNHPFSQLGVGL